jgi:integrase
MKQNQRRKNREGTIYQRSDGRWETKLSTDGGQRKSLYGATEQEVLDKLTSTRNQQLDHIPLSDERLTLRQWLNTWLENIRPPVVKSKSWVTYENHARLHLTPSLGHIRLKKLQPQDVRDFMAKKLEAGYSTGSVKDFHAALRTALQRAMEDELVHRNVAKLAKPPQVERNIPGPWTLEEARQCIAAVRTSPGSAVYGGYRARPARGRV